MTDDYLVPGRTCGSCRACAALPGVDAATLGDDRTQGFHCLWRRFDRMADAWRPDRGGLVMTLAEPPADGRGAVVQFWLTADPAVLETADFAGMAAGFVSNGTGMILALVDPAAVLVRLDPLIVQAVRDRDLDGVLDGIRHARALLFDQAGGEPAPFMATAPLAPGMPLVEGRECGECIACCVIPEIDDPQLTKPAGVTCRNCLSGGGCAIYADRPEICRKFHCLWRRMPALDDSWRPDRSGIMFTAGDGPGRLPGMPKLEVLVIDETGRARAETEAFARIVAGCTEAGADTVLQRLCPGGAEGRHCHLTGRLMPGVLAGDLASVQAAIIERLDHLEAEIAAATAKS